jgi:hypothetical protein
MMVQTRLWLAGEVRKQRGMTRMRRLIARVRQGVAYRLLLWCMDGFASAVRALRETCRAPGRTDAQGRPRRRAWRYLDIAQVVKRYVQGRVVDVERRIVDGTPARVAALRRRSPGHGVIHTADIERLKAMFRERLASLTRRSRALVRHPLPRRHGMDLIGSVDNFCTYHASLCLAASAAGIGVSRGRLTSTTLWEITLLAIKSFKSSSHNIGTVSFAE